MNPKLLTEDEIFRVAFQIPTSEARIEYLKQVCQSDAEVERIVALLKEGDPDASFLEKGPGLMAATANMETGLSGETIGPYKLLQEIGAGGFGVVYMAEQVSPVRRKVALKIIKPGMDTKQFVARFEAERQALAMMDHPNIAKILDGGETDKGRPYFVMELVKGVPLTEFCDSNRLSTQERLELFVTICQAVQHAHQKGVIHRDLKPSNVMITLHDNRPVPKIIDFGVSKAISQQLTEKTLFTAYGQMVGTPVYMSPEQAQMSGLDIDTRSDIYSLGVLLYELLTGTTPLDSTCLRGTAYLEMQRLILESDSPKPSTRLSTLGDQLPMIARNRGIDADRLSQLLKGDLDWIVMKAIDKERNRRYESAGSFAADIQRFLEDEEVEARPPSVAYKINKFMRRNKGPVIAGTLVVVTLLFGIVGTTLGMLRAKRDAERNLELTDLANDSLQSERRAKVEAKAVGQKLLDQNYFQLINLAQVALEKGRAANALSLLGDCPENLRHWEWRYLYRAACSARHEPQQFEFDQDIVSFDWDPSSPNEAVVMTVDGTLTQVSVTEEKLTGHLLEKQLDYQEVSSIEPVADVEFSPDGKMLAVSLGSNGAQIVDLTTGKVFARRTDSVSGLAFHPDTKKRQLASAGHDRVIRLWDLDETKQPHEFAREETWWIKDVKYSRDSKWLATCNNSGVASVYSTATGQCKHRLEGHYGPVWTLAMSHDSRYLATAGADFKIVLWDMATGALVREFRGHSAMIDSLDFCVDDTRLVSMGRDSRVRMWHVDSGREILTLQIPGVQKHRNRIAFSQDGDRIAAITGRSMAIFDATHGAKLTVPIAQLDYDGRRILDVDFMERDRVVACSGEQGVLLWDLATNQRRPIDFLGPMTTAIDVHPNGREIAIMLLRSKDKRERVQQVIVWDSVTGEVTNQSNKSIQVRGSVSFQRDGGLLATGGVGASRFWDLQVPLDQQEGRLNNSAGIPLFSACGRYMVGQHNQSREVWIWDATDATDANAGRLLYQNEVPFTQFVFSRNGERGGLGDVDGNATVLSIRPNEDGTHGVISWKATDDIISTVTLTPEGRYLATAGTDGVIRIWDLDNVRQQHDQTRPELVQVLIEGDPVFNIEFSQDGRRLVSGGHSRVVKLWDTSFLYP